MLLDFFAQYRKFHYKKGEIFLRPEDEPKGIFYLAKGYVRVYSISSDGEELTLIIFKPDDFFPLIWALNGGDNNYYLEAITTVELGCAPKEDFLEFLNKNPKIILELTSRILTRMEGLLTRMEYLVFGNAYSKVVSIIAICAERFGEVKDGQIVIQFPLPHRMIANFVGITRETASLEVKKLERTGLIAHKGRFLVINDLKNLKKESLNFFSN